VSDPGTLLERALRVASLKSARYSVVEPILLGATLAGADAGLLASLRDFGHPVGMAFQLRDDMLGVFGDPALTGKPAGDDLREGKRTALIAMAREDLPDADRALLDAGLGDRSLSESAISELQELIRSTGAVQRMERMISGFTDDAERALANAGIADDAAEALRALVTAAITRTA
jgi:geranylgeranyl diphosphate synthase type I